ncbi:MAG: ABC transporter permease subunit [Pseudomonadota bacterium]
MEGFSTQIAWFFSMLGGAVLTVQIVALVMILGIMSGTGMALMRLSKNRAVAGFAYGYVFVFRGTPLLLQLYLIYYGLAQFDFVRQSFLWAFFREPYWCAILALTMNTTAYTAEIVRGGILSVPHGQVEAARATGMSKLLMFRRLTIPLTIRQALPAYGNEVILMIKASSLASTITVVEITGVARRLYSRSYDPEVFMIAGAIYLLINWIAAEVVHFAEYRMTPYLRRRTDKGKNAPLIERFIARPLGLGQKAPV